MPLTASLKGVSYFARDVPYELQVHKFDCFDCKESLTVVREHTRKGSPVITYFKHPPNSQCEKQSSRYIKEFVTPYHLEWVQFVAADHVLRKVQHGMIVDVIGSHDELIYFRHSQVKSVIETERAVVFVLNSQTREYTACNATVEDENDKNPYRSGLYLSFDRASTDVPLLRTDAAVRIYVDIDDHGNAGLYYLDRTQPIHPQLGYKAVYYTMSDFVRAHLDGIWTGGLDSIKHDVASVTLCTLCSLLQNGDCRCDRMVNKFRRDHIEHEGGMVCFNKRWDSVNASKPSLVLRRWETIMLGQKLDRLLDYLDDKKVPTSRPWVREHKSMIRRIEHRERYNQGAMTDDELGKIREVDDFVRGK